MSDYKDTMIMLLKSTAYHALPKIEGKRAKQAYRKAIVQCAELLSSRSVEDSKIDIMQYSKFAELLYPSKFLRFNYEAAAHTLACKQSAEIIDSINLRFVNGYFSYSDPIHGGFSNENESIF